jgi:hypothetical protein
MVVRLASEHADANVFFAIANTPIVNQQLPQFIPRTVFNKVFRQIWDCKRAKDWNHNDVSQSKKTRHAK